jgi:hypothetical protein
MATTSNNTRKLKLLIAQGKARELLKALERLATHEQPGYYGSEISAVKETIEKLKVEEQYA